MSQTSTFQSSTPAVAAMPGSLPDVSASTAEPSTLESVRGLFDSVTTIFSSGDALANTDTLLRGLSGLGYVWATIFLVVGLLTLFNGYRWYRIATVITALLLGLFAGYALGEHIEAPFIIAGCMGALLFVVAFPLMKYVVAALGGLAGGFIGANLWSAAVLTIQKLNPSSQLDASDYWVGALIGLMVCGMLAFVVWKLSIVVYTSVSGSTLAVIGGIGLLLAIDPLRGPVAEALSRSRMVVPLLVLVPAAIGLILQESRREPAADG